MPNHTAQNVSKRARNSSLELLRIVAILFIILSHACCHSHFDYASSGMSLNKLFVQWGALGHIGSGLFMLISGYCCACKKRRNQSLIRLWLQVWFYSLLLFVICKFGFRYSYSLYEFFVVFLPGIFQEYWFFTAYAVICLLSPYINIFLETADRESFRKLLIVMFVLWVFIPTFTLQSLFGSSLVQMLFYYILGAYLRIYPNPMLKKQKLVVGITISSFLLLFTSTFVFDYLGEFMELFKDKGGTFYTKESLLIVTCTIGLFVFFVNLRPFSNKVIDTIAACTFGVYLIHDNPAMRNILWLQVFRHADHFNSPNLIMRIIVSVLIVFWGSTLIEYIRMRVLDRSFTAIASFVDEKFVRWRHCCLRLTERFYVEDQGNN